MIELSIKQSRERRMRRAAYMRLWRAARKAAEARYEASQMDEAAEAQKPPLASAEAGRG